MVETPVRKDRVFDSRSGQHLKNNSFFFSIQLPIYVNCATFFRLFLKFLTIFSFIFIGSGTAER